MASILAGTMPSPMSLCNGFAIIVLAARFCQAQQTGEDADTAALKQMMLLSKGETRVALLDQFRADFQKAELIPWAYERICESFEAVNLVDRALSVGERLLALDPQAIEIAQSGLKIAEKGQDASL